MVDNWTYNGSVPATNNNPSADQPLMLQNTQSIASLINEDHIGFNTNFGGYHTIVHLQDQGASVPTPVAGFGEIYAGTPGSTTELFYETPAGVVTQITGPNGLNGVIGKAAVNFSGSGSINYQTNVSSIAKINIGVFQVNFTTPFTDANYYVSGVCQPVDASHDIFMMLAPNPGLQTVSKVVLQVVDDDGNFRDPQTVQVIISK